MRELDGGVVVFVQSLIFIIMAAIYVIVYLTYFLPIPSQVRLCHVMPPIGAFGILVSMESLTRDTRKSVSRALVRSNGQAHDYNCSTALS